MIEHPYAAIFPLLTGKAFDALVEDIKQNGLNEPIVTLDGQVLDGRNRWRACLAAGVTPRFVEWDPARGDPKAWVMSTNLTRRHLNGYQRAMIAARLDLTDLTALAVSKNLVTRAKRLLVEDPALAEEVFAGRRTLPVPPRTPRPPGVIPSNHEIKSVSILTDADGQVKGEWTKTQVTPEDPPAQEIVPPGFTVQRTSTMLDREGKALIQWVSSDRDKAEQWAAMWDACKQATAEYRGLADPVVMPTLVDARLLNVIPIGDPHIGMLAWAKETGQDFDSKIARTDLLRAMRMLFDRSPNAKTALIAQLGDFFHAEDDKQVTPTAGHKLDVDTRAGRITRLGFDIMRTSIDLALTKHEKVVVANLRGNHDPYKSIALNLWLQAVYEREPRVEILDNNNPYVFYEHGLCLIGLHHGDGAKPNQLPGIMATYLDGVPWGRARHRKWFTGHIHSEHAADFAGCSWQSCRTLAPGDYWAHHKGYRSEQSIECHTYDEDDGLVSRQPITLRLVRKAA